MDSLIQNWCRERKTIKVLERAHFIKFLIRELEIGARLQISSMTEKGIAQIVKRSISLVRAQVHGLTPQQWQRITIRLIRTLEEELKAPPVVKRKEKKIATVEKRIDRLVNEYGGAKLKVKKLKVDGDDLP